MQFQLKFLLGKSRLKDLCQRKTDILDMLNTLYRTVHVHCKINQIKLDKMMQKRHKLKQSQQNFSIITGKIEQH